MRRSACGPVASATSPTFTALTPVAAPKAVWPLAFDERTMIVEAPCAVRSASSASEGISVVPERTISGASRTIWSWPGSQLSTPTPAACAASVGKGAATEA